MSKKNTPPRSRDLKTICENASNDRVVDGCRRFDTASQPVKGGATVARPPARKGKSK